MPRSITKHRKPALAVALAAVLMSAVPAASAGAVTAPARGNQPRAANDQGGWVVNQQDTYKVAQEDGPGSINQTDTRWDVYGADLGSMFLYHNQIRMVFGDSFGGPAAYPFFSVSHSDYRDNLMAVIGPPNSTRPPVNGLKFSSMISDSPGHTKDLLATDGTPWPGHLIPTHVVSVGNTMYLYYTDVKVFGAPGHWTLYHSGIAYSTDGGNTWTDSPGTRWPARSNFGQTALVKQGQYIYVYGIPGGRYGSLQLARVPEHQVLDKAAYQYWTGTSWTSDPATATDIVHAPVGELWVRYNSYYKKWIMMYLDDPKGEVVLRTADQPTGPWSPAQIVVTSAQYPQLYAPYITPRWNSGADIYFTMSVFDHYQVYLMHTSLQKTQAGS